MTYTLLPRSTGLHYSLRALSPCVPSLQLLDITVGYPGTPHSFILIDGLSWSFQEFHPWVTVNHITLCDPSSSIAYLPLSFICTSADLT